MKVLVKVRWIKEVKALMIECLTFQPINNNTIGEILISIGNLLCHKTRETWHDAN